MLEDPSVRNTNHQHHVPRATLILGAGEGPSRRSEIWMGGAHSLIGETVEPSHVEGACLIDCAGDLDRQLRPLASLWLPCVFPDLDGPLSASLRIEGTVARAVEHITGASAPQRLFVMCTHGMNRSGLVTGLILRRLGMGPGETVDRIREARPGALSNDYFRRLLLAD